VRFRALLIEDGTLTEKGADQVEQDAYAAIDAAVGFADASPEPDVATIEDGVYA
jgi:pyruvate dehydrogenase E1 component alpha subunit